MGEHTETVAADTCAKDGGFRSCKANHVGIPAGGEKVIESRRKIPGIFCCIFFRPPVNGGIRHSEKLSDSWPTTKLGGFAW